MVLWQQQEEVDSLVLEELLGEEEGEWVDFVPPALN